MQFTVMSFNLRYWNQGDGEHSWPQRRDSVGEVIRQNNPLVMGTQEGLLKMLEDLDERIPAYGRVGEGRWEGDENEYSAVYYRKDLLDVVSTHQIWLSETPDVPGSKSWDSSLPRICTWAVFSHKETGKKFAFFNTHLDHRGSEARQKGTELIWKEMSKYIEQGMPCFLTGDFNATPDSAPITFLRSKLVDALESQGKGTIGTFHGFRGATEHGPIDYIFCTDDIKVLDGEVIDYEVNGILPSDHFPIIARVEL